MWSVAQGFGTIATRAVSRTPEKDSVHHSLFREANSIPLPPLTVPIHFHPIAPFPASSSLPYPPNPFALALYHVIRGAGEGSRGI